MRDRLLSAGTAVARLVLVVVAFGLAVGSIGLSSTRGFCPEHTEQALAMPVLASIVEPEATGEDGPTAGTEAPGTQVPGTEAPGTEAPADEGSGTDGEDAAGACPGGAQRCLPPLWSSILILGDAACHDQAPARLRSILVPAFVGSTILLAGAWWLRPGHLPFATRTTTGTRAP